MNTGHTKESLVAFERRIAEFFNAGQIRAPVHFSGGNEEQLLEIFKEVRHEDWLCTSWRSHYHCLLKGVPEAQLEGLILAGQSISLNIPEYRIVSSAMVAGMAPIAAGIGLGLRGQGSRARVWCFLGDMAAETGIAHESIKFCDNWALNVSFIIEDNGLSVCGDTRALWRGWTPHEKRHANVTRYRYQLTWPHAGAGHRVQF